jgi:hypothetical protein
MPTSAIAKAGRTRPCVSKRDSPEGSRTATNTVLSLTGSAPNRGQQQFDKGANGNHCAFHSPRIHEVHVDGDLLFEKSELYKRNIRAQNPLDLVHLYRDSRRAAHANGCDVTTSR